ncbi:serum amyloid P-component-like [Anomaloglossus baeobatrachus]|uniref:serum amyloid P-component-like n=1 Tax=Anomaloglossus baeobatrachus TaxID=238106 RepID=UPI003F509940
MEFLCLPKLDSQDFDRMLIWLMLWISGALGQRDMEDKLFAFPKESSTSYVRLLPEYSGPFSEATVCMRFHSNLTREYSLFSLATLSRHNAFLLYYYPGKRNQFLLSVDNEDHYYDLQGNNFTEWTSICATWNSSTWVLWIDATKYNKNGKQKDVKISANPIIIIGQEQDSYGGNFKASESFVGEITDVNMWNKTLTDENIMDYFATDEMSGNIINWNALDYKVFEDVNIQPYVDPYPCISV